MNQITQCAGCDKPLTFRWADTHGVGVCVDCALPYVIYHYEGEGDERKRVEKPPECPIFPEWIEIGRRYHAETGGKMFPGEFSFMSCDGITYCGATDGDRRAWNKWLEAHKAELPKRREGAAQLAE